MTVAGRYVLLGAAPARAPWFSTLARWATTAALPAEFVKCVSVEDVRARLTSGRPFSALLVDARLAGLDRDVLDAATSRGVPVVVVGGGTSRSWTALGACAVLPALPEHDELLDVLRRHARTVSCVDELPGQPAAAVAPPAWQAPLVMVCGPGGTGASTVAAALAQGLAAAGRPASVVLADLALRADQAMLHDAGDVVPGVQELVEAHRRGQLPPEAVRSFTFLVEARGYALLLGLRRARDWSALRPRAVEAAIDALRGAFDVVVCDCTADVEGEEEGGSVDVEERNVLARTAARRAAAVVVVGLPGLKGVHSLVRTLGELRVLGLPPPILLPVVNRAPRGRRERTAIAAAVTALSPVDRPVLFLPSRPVDDAFRDGTPLPDALAAPLAATLRSRLVAPAPAQPAGPVRVAPGTLGFAGDI